ncbi:pentapeptide repeat-containing protein [Isoptericola halotolerans]|uniref:pentapeptide repeat-containing protein n=1 Tax=Isoptericola halotolerans TaxID=300560 RepID=UPI00388D91B4
MADSSGSSAARLNAFSGAIHRKVVAVCAATTSPSTPATITTHAGLRVLVSVTVSPELGRAVRARRPGATDVAPGRRIILRSSDSVGHRRRTTLRRAQCHRARTGQEERDREIRRDLRTGLWEHATPTGVGGRSTRPTAASRATCAASTGAPARTAGVGRCQGDLEARDDGIILFDARGGTRVCPGLEVRRHDERPADLAVGVRRLHREDERLRVDHRLDLLAGLEARRRERLLLAPLDLVLGELGRQVPIVLVTVDFGAVDFGAVDFGAVDFGAVDFGAVDFGAVDFGAVDFGAVDFGAVDFGAVDFGAVDFGAVDFGAVDFGAVDFGAVDFGAVDFGAVDFGAVDFGAVDLDAVNFNSVDLDAVNFNSVNFNAVDLGAAIVDGQGSFCFLAGGVVDAGGGVVALGGFVRDGHRGGEGSLGVGGYVLDGGDDGAFGVADLDRDGGVRGVAGAVHGDGVTGCGGVRGDRDRQVQHLDGSHRGGGQVDLGERRTARQQRERQCPLREGLGTRRVVRRELARLLLDVRHQAHDGVQGLECRRQRRQRRVDHSGVDGARQRADQSGALVEEDIVQRPRECVGEVPERQGDRQNAQHHRDARVARVNGAVDDIPDRAVERDVEACHAKDVALSGECQSRRLQRRVDRADESERQVVQSGTETVRDRC